MKIVLSVFLAIAIVGCVLFGIAYTGTNSQLTAAQTELKGAQDELVLAQSDLQNTEMELTTAKDSLANTEADLHNAKEAVTEKEIQLADAKLELTDMTHRYDNAVADKAGFLRDYSALRETIYRRLGIDTDSQRYITPQDLSVMLQVASVAGAFSTNADEMWRDYQRMYQWVVDNILYYGDTNLPVLPETPDGPLEWMAEYWKMPSETIADSSGDCEDMSNLLASMILNYNNDAYAAWVIIIHNQDSGHAAVAIPVIGGKLVIFDPAGNYYSGMSLGYVQSATTSSAISTWLAHWADQMPGAQVTAVYSNDFFLEFASTQAFIQWANDR